MIWMSRIRLRVLAFLLGIVLTAIGVLSLTALPALPVVGVAFAAAAMAVNSMTARLKHPTCHGCGEVLRDTASGEYGVVCPSCGSLSQVRLASGGPGAGDDEIA
ncbi:MAG TPA: hypothetical protein VFF69_03390 [Phycisphaerales bacterium]|nr:hypothetical protein [Phycisphaerales bacterium]